MNLQHRVPDAALMDIPACPLCESHRFDARSTPPPNLYSEQLSQVLGCEESALLAAVQNLRCAECGLWYKPRWFRAEILRALFTQRVPDHPKGWDAVSDRFSEHGFARELIAWRAALAASETHQSARYRRSLSSIIDSIVTIDAPLRNALLRAIDAGEVERLDALRPALASHFAEPAAFKRFSGFSSHTVWEWMESHLGPVRDYGEVGCPLWGQLVRPPRLPGTRIFFQRPENNYWGNGCRRDGQHCSARLAQGGTTALHPWPPAPGLRLDALGAFQYLDHLEHPAAFVTEAFAHAHALLLILDGVEAPLAIQHFTGWDQHPIRWLAAANGKRVASDFTTMHASGNHSWLLFHD